MICAQAVVHFRPQAAYEKYLKLLVSAMVLIQLFLPVSRLLFHGSGEELEKETQAFLEGLEEELSAAESRAYETDALLEQMTLEEIRRRAEEADSGDSRREGSGTEGSGREGSGTEDGGTEGSRREDGGTEDGGTEGSRREGSGREGSEAGNGVPGIGESQDPVGTTGSAAEDNTIRIDRVQVEEIRIPMETESPE